VQRYTNSPPERAVLAPFVPRGWIYGLSLWYQITKGCGPANHFHKMATTDNSPFVGGYFSPYEDGRCRVLRLVKEDDEFYYFEDLSRHSKDLPWWMFRMPAPAGTVESNEPFVFPYHSYSLWSRQLAAFYTVPELQKVVDECEKLSGLYTAQHLAAVEKSASMGAQSQRRAQSRNKMAANYEKKMAYTHAIEVQLHYPEKCKS